MMRALIFFAAILLTSCAAQKQGVPNSKKKRIDQLIKAQAERQSPGFSVAVVENGKIVYERSTGLANVEKDLAATSQTNYRIASVTKQFTACAILQLVNKGQLSLTDNLRKFFPEFPAYANAITVHHLLNHRSGLIDYEDVMDKHGVAVLDADVQRILVKQDHTYFPPGTQYRYSNSGYAILARIVEKVSGKSFEWFINSQIFVPLGMKNSSMNIRGINIPHRAYGYTKDTTGYAATDQSLTSYVLGDGGIYTSMEDMARWSANLVEDQPVLPGILQWAGDNSDAIAGGGRNARYGCGWQIDEYKNEKRFFHTGSSVGFSTYHAVYPGKKIGVIVFSNRVSPTLNTQELGDQIGAIMLEP